MTPDEIAEFKSWGVPLPTRDAHGTPEQIREKLERAVPTNWRLEGNVLMCDTQFGPLAQYIDPSLILTGVDDEGLPILAAVKL